MSVSGFWSWIVFTPDKMPLTTEEEGVARKAYGEATERGVMAAIYRKVIDNHDNLPEVVG